MIGLYQFYNIKVGETGEPFALCEKHRKEQVIPDNCALNRLAENPTMECNQCSQGSHKIKEVIVEPTNYIAAYRYEEDIELAILLSDKHKSLKGLDKDDIPLPKDYTKFHKIFVEPKSFKILKAKFLHLNTHPFYFLNLKP